MFKFNNTHIFTGYLKQLLSTTNIPACKIYTKEFAEYFKQHGKEDPRIVESIDTINKDRLAVRVNYLKNNELYSYFLKYSEDDSSKPYWKKTSTAFYNKEKCVPGLTKVLNSPGASYDSVTHEYLGDYLRFLRDYYDVNLMSLYNCFSNRRCNNIYYNEINDGLTVFDSQDTSSTIYAVPVKLFSSYTIAIDSYGGVEMFCGLYNTHLDVKTAKGKDLIAKTYVKVKKAIFKQPFLFDKLSVEYWNHTSDFATTDQKAALLNNEVITCFDIINREQDLKLFIKVPTSCKSSIVILEGDFRHFNDSTYVNKNKQRNDDDDDDTAPDSWVYNQNHSIINFEDTSILNHGSFRPISKLQLLELNTGESYPFADRLIEYLAASAITPIDEIPDNIRRVQSVMNENQHFFKIEGVWEDKMQKIVYDYIMNGGPVKIENGILIDKHRGYQPQLGHTTKSTVYDILGYVDRNAEKWYASWKTANNKEAVKNNIQNVDIYDGMYEV